MDARFMTVSEDQGSAATGDPVPPGVFSGPVAPVATPRTATEAYQVAAWRAPTATRFDGRPANDVLAGAQTIVPDRIYRAVPAPAPGGPAGLLTFAVGALVAAVLGALLGGLLSV